MTERIEIFSPNEAGYGAVSPAYDRCVISVSPLERRGPGRTKTAKTGSTKVGYTADPARHLENWPSVENYVLYYSLPATTGGFKVKLKEKMNDAFKSFFEDEKAKHVSETIRPLAEKEQADMAEVRLVISALELDFKLDAELDVPKLTADVKEDMTGRLADLRIQEELLKRRLRPSLSGAAAGTDEDEDPLAKRRQPLTRSAAVRKWKQTRTARDADSKELRRRYESTVSELVQSELDITAHALNTKILTKIYAILSTSCDFMNILHLSAGRKIYYVQPFWSSSSTSTPSALGPELGCWMDGESLKGTNNVGDRLVELRTKDVKIRRALLSKETAIRSDCELLTIYRALATLEGLIKERDIKEFIGKTPEQILDMAYKNVAVVELTDPIRTIPLYGLSADLGTAGVERWMTDRKLIKAGRKVSRVTRTSEDVPAFVPIDVVRHIFDANKNDFADMVNMVRRHRVGLATLVRKRRLAQLRQDMLLRESMKTFECFLSWVLQSDPKLMALSDVQQEAEVLDEVSVLRSTNYRKYQEMVSDTQRLYQNATNSRRDESEPQLDPDTVKSMTECLSAYRALHGTPPSEEDVRKLEYMAVKPPFPTKSDPGPPVLDFAGLSAQDAGIATALVRDERAQDSLLAFIQALSDHERVPFQTVSNLLSFRQNDPLLIKEARDAASEWLSRESGSGSSVEDLAEQLSNTEQEDRQTALAAQLGGNQVYRKERLLMYQKGITDLFEISTSKRTSVITAPGARVVADSTSPLILSSTATGSYDHGMKVTPRGQDDWMTHLLPTCNLLQWSVRSPLFYEGIGFPTVLHCLVYQRIRSLDVGKVPAVYYILNNDRDGGVGQEALTALIEPIVKADLGIQDITPDELRQHVFQIFDDSGASSKLDFFPGLLHNGSVKGSLSVIASLGRRGIGNAVVNALREVTGGKIPKKIKSEHAATALLECCALPWRKLGATLRGITRRWRIDRANSAASKANNLKFGLVDNGHTVPCELAIAQLALMGKPGSDVEIVYKSFNRITGAGRNDRGSDVIGKDLTRVKFELDSRTQDLIAIFDKHWRNSGVPSSRTLKRVGEALKGDNKIQLRKAALIRNNPVLAQIVSQVVMSYRQIRGRLQCLVRAVEAITGKDTGQPWANPEEVAKIVMGLVVYYRTSKQRRPDFYLSSVRRGKEAVGALAHHVGNLIDQMMIQLNLEGLETLDGSNLGIWVRMSIEEYADAVLGSYQANVNEPFNFVCDSTYARPTKDDLTKAGEKLTDFLVCVIKIGDEEKGVSRDKISRAASAIMSNDGRARLLTSIQ